MFMAGCHTDRDKNSGATGNQSETNYNFSTNQAPQSSGGVGDESGKATGNSDSNTPKNNGNSKDVPNPTPDNTPK